MPKSVFSTWVKNVHKLRTQRRETQGKVSTHPTLPTVITSLLVNKPQVIPSFVHGFYPQLFTATTTHYNPLISHLYPLSTEPTIKRKKEN